MCLAPQLQGTNEKAVCAEAPTLSTHPPYASDFAN